MLILYGQTQCWGQLGERRAAPTEPAARVSSARNRLLQCAARLDFDRFAAGGLFLCAVATRQVELRNDAAENGGDARRFLNHAEV